MTAARQSEVEAARAVVAAMDDADDRGHWLPEHYDTCEAAAKILRGLVQRHDDRERQRAIRKQGHPSAGRLKPSRGNETPPAARAAVVARSGGLCEVDTDACPAGKHYGDQIHHRDRNRKNNTPENLLHVCTLGHGFIHEHPEESFAAGWMAQRNGAVAQPLYLRGQG